MLQQTRVAVVAPAYRSFLRAFPHLRALARASEDEVLSRWSGLGYYARARALQRAARLIDAKGARAFPTSLAAARDLPGVGPYTAAAVLSIAHGLPHAAVDANVSRVLSRLACLQPRTRGRALQTLAERLLDRRRPGDWNQALMELGETTCTARKPACDDCPVRRFCAAFRRGQVSRYPRRRARRAIEQIELRMTLAFDRRGRLLLERGSFPYLPHLWLPPIEVISRRARAMQYPLDRRDTFCHGILHRSFRVGLLRRQVTARELRGEARGRNATERRLFGPTQLASIGRSALLTKALRRAGVPPPAPATG
jgi:A/G-specific adenine glycosylase